MSNAVSKLFNSRFGVRLALPAVVTVGAVGTALAYPQVVSASSPTLAGKTPAQLIESALRPSGRIYSGTIVETSGLGLPTSFVNQLSGGSAPSGLSGLLTQALTSGVTANFWTNHASSLRIQVPSTSGEFDLYASAGSVWEWDSTTNTATDLRLPSGAKAVSHARATASTPPSPSAIADALLSHLPAGAAVTVNSPEYVAGQPAYVLNLAPNDPSSLIGGVRIAVDASTGNVLGVWITPRGSSSAAFSVYYSAVSFKAPSSSVFSFSVPSGATVKTLRPGAVMAPVRRGTTTAPAVTHKSIGTGFSTVEVVTGLPRRPASSSLMSGLLGSGTKVTTAIGQGTVVTTSVATVFIGNNGTLAFGAVPRSVLLADLGQG